MLRSLERTVDDRELYNIFLKHIFSRKLISVDKFLNRVTRVDEIEKTLSLSGRSCLNELTTDIINIYRKVTFSSFKEKVLADVEAVKAAHAEINSATIEPSFIPKKQVDTMLKYYLQGYKTKFAEEIKSGDAKFFDDLAGQVVESLNKYIKFSWHQLHDISKGLEVLVSTGEEGDTEGEYLQAVPKGAIGLIGEYVVFNDTQEIVE